MSVKDDLIAARGLIDTPEKFAAMPFGVLGALSDVCPEEEGVTAADPRFNAMRNALIGRTDSLGDLDLKPHPDIMSLFDRAIAAAGASE